MRLEEDKLDEQTYKKVYPSGSLTPTANPAIKAHKPAKQYPARLITSHIGAPQEALASLLNEILKVFIEKSPFVCKNSFEFVNTIKSLKLGPNDKMVSFDATALFPSVPINDCITHIHDLLTQDTELHRRTKLSPTDITDLIRICLSSSDFVYDDRHHTTEDSGPIGLSLMVTVSQIWMTHTMESAIETAKQRLLIIPRHIFVYMDDCWCVIHTPPAPRRPGLRSSDPPRSDPAVEFNNCLNSVHERVQFTREEEDKLIAFLDVHVTRESDGSLSTKIFRKPSNTNIGLKPQSCQDPKIVEASFKGELCRCYRLCTSLEQTQKEIQFTLDLYEDNGHNREKVKKIADGYSPPMTTKKKGEKTNRDRRKKKAESPENEIKDLFRALPCRSEEDLQEEEEEAKMEFQPYACIQYIPGIAYPIKRALAKAGVNCTFTSGPKLKDVLCGKNKTRPDPQQRKGVYKYECPCSEKAIYVGQTARSCELRWAEHEKAIEKENWQHSGISQHHQHCEETFDQANASVITTMQDKNKKRLNYNLKIREALDIRRHNCGPGKGLSEDMGAYVKTDLWDPILHTI